MQGSSPAAPDGALPNKETRKNERAHFYGFSYVWPFAFAFFVFLKFFGGAGVLFSKSTPAFYFQTLICRDDNQSAVA